MRSVIRPIRIPEDMDREIDALAANQGKTRSQILKGCPLIAFGDWFASRLGAKRYNELVGEYHADERGKGEE